MVEKSFSDALNALSLDTAPARCLSEVYRRVFLTAVSFEPGALGTIAIRNDYHGATAAAIDFRHYNRAGIPVEDGAAPTYSIRTIARLCKIVVDDAPYGKLARSPLGELLERLDRRDDGCAGRRFPKRPREAASSSRR